MHTVIFIPQTTEINWRLCSFLALFYGKLWYYSLIEEKFMI